MATRYKKFTDIKDDRRVKLTDDQRIAIQAEYRDGFSQRYLAKKYEVSRRLIQFTVDPEKLEHARKLFKERRKDGRYARSNYESKESWAKRQRELRARKRALGLAYTI